MAENPADLVVAGVERCLEYAATWHAWDGRPIAGTVDGSVGLRPNVWTPAKALRRINDHLVDHLHEVAALTPASRASSPAASGRSARSARSMAARVGSAMSAAAWAMSVS